jgi:hypothetical protein
MAAYVANEAALRLQIPLEQDFAMMELMADEDAGDCQDGDRGIIGRTVPQPCFGRKAAKELHIRPTNRFELPGQLFNGSPVELSGRDIAVLIESRQRCLIAAGDSQGAVAHHPFGIGHMADDFLQTPFAFGIAKAASIRRSEQQLSSLQNLRGKKLEQVSFGYASDVAGIVRMNSHARQVAASSMTPLVTERRVSPAALHAALLQPSSASAKKKLISVRAFSSESDP